MSDNSWQPSAPLANLRERARLLSQLRDFFRQKNVLEVTTPSLSRAGITDVYLDNFVTHFAHDACGQPTSLYLQTSPEYAMKRLLAAGSGCIYQIAPAFRHESGGAMHNPEFTLLEWYRVGFSLSQLMDEMEELLQLTLNCTACDTFSYQDVFVHHTSIDPLAASKETLYQFCLHENIAVYAPSSDLTQDDLLQLIFNVCIEPKIGQSQPCFIYGFPASQAALAKLNPQDNRVAQRFEVYYQGVELANGFDELTDAAEQERRFKHDNAQRLASGMQARPIDTRLVAALNAGLPQCAGVALGIDRLLMLKLNAEKIDDVIAFPVHLA